MLRDSRKVLNGRPCVGDCRWRGVVGWRLHYSRQLDLGPLLILHWSLRYCFWLTNRWRGDTWVTCEFIEIWNTKYVQHCRWFTYINSVYCNYMLILLKCCFLFTFNASMHCVIVFYWKQNFIVEISINILYYWLATFLLFS